ncbi:protein Simiate [Cimex lectularius]|uniref:Protein Abitram n=1 Tax=Cimex lectularius TaxID=79782 RepID=A0A8I6RNZ3_CIMLE|nr:protein Simiate [Cimex lectularius]
MSKSYIPPPIEKSYDCTEAYASPEERYFTERYALDVRFPGDDYRIFIHSNRICIVTLAPSHEMLMKEQQVAKVDFQVTDKRNTLESKVSGKRKHGAQRLLPTTPLFIAECGHSSYKPCTGITGKLLEVNKALKENPQLLISDPCRKGFLAILLPDPTLVETYKKELTTKEEFQKRKSQHLLI